MNIKNTFLYIILCIISLSFCGCGVSMLNGEQESLGTTPEEQMENIDVTVNDNPQDVDLLISDKLWEDNTKDIYTGVIRNVFDIHEQSPEGLQMSSIPTLYSSGKGIWLKKFFFEEFKNNKEYICFGQPDGSFFDLELNPENYGLQGAVLMAGPSIDTEEFILYISTRKDGAFIDSFAVIDSEGNCVRTFMPDKKIDLHTYAPIQMILDKEGNTCFWTSTETGLHYFVMDKEGKLILEKYDTEYVDIDFLVMLDGEIRLLVMTEEYTMKIISVDLETGKEKEVFDLSRLQEDSGRFPILFATIDNNDNIYYVNAEGIYLSENGKKTEALYLFRNHGITVRDVSSMEVNEAAEISIMFAGAEATEFMVLQPTHEQKELIEIPFVIAESSKTKYKEAIVSFNKKYPNYLISIVEYEDASLLNTELIAGQGPVLVDTSLTGFEEKEDFWECLDEEIDSINIGNSLLENLGSTGQINGKQYGVVTDWYMFSFVGCMDDIEDWNQQEFLEYLRNNPQIERIFEYQSPELFMNLFFLKNLNECMFWDIETQEVKFTSKDFLWLIEKAKDIAREDENGNRADIINEVRNGKRLGMYINISSPEAFADYDTRLGEEINYIGFPGMRGSEHYICSSAPIAVRATASDAQKHGAILFLQHLLSYDVQKEMAESVSTFSVRKDVLKESLDNMNEYAYFTVEEENFEIPVDKEVCKKRFWNMYENAVVMPKLPNELENILSEELQSYFCGQKNAQQVIDILQSRVQVYLYE